MFTHSVRLFDILGFEIRIDASWLLIAALIVWSLSSGYFPMILPGYEAGAYLTLAIVAMLGLFGSLLLHELAHSVVARRYGLNVGSITLFLFGGVAELQDEPESATSEFWIAIAGPVMSFVLAAFFALATQLATPETMTAALMDYLATINLVLAVFNMIPAFPLDGGRILRAWLWRRWGDMLAATRVASQAGVALALALMALGLFSVMSGGGVGGIWMGLIGLFVLTASRATYQQLLLRTTLAGRSVAELMTERPYCADPDMSLTALSEDIMLAHAVSFVPVVQGGTLLGYIDTQILRGIPREDWPRTPVAEVYVALAEDNVIAPGQSAEAALRRLAEGGHRKLLVAEGRRLCGVLSIRDLMGHIAIMQELSGGPSR